MKKLLLSAALLTGTLFTTEAQENDDTHKRPKPPTQTEWNFNMPSLNVNIRDYAYLPNKAKMIIELTNVEQYKELGNLDSVLRVFLQEISFYKDSLENGCGPVRIDYAIDEAFSFNKIRFKKHASDGQIFMSRPNDKALLKLDQDTVRIYYRHNPVVDAGKDSWNIRKYYPRFYQVTFCVNNYTDLAAIAADKATLQHALDTLYATKRESTRENPYYNPSSARYNPYAPALKETRKGWLPYADLRFKQYGGLVESDNARNWSNLQRSDVLTLTANVGAGLIRNVLAPTAEMGLQINHHGKRLYHEKYHTWNYRLYASSFFFFDKDLSGNYLVKDNWFVNFDMCEQDDLYFGAGYLFAQKGDYFKGVTTKLHFDVRLLKSGLTLSPQIIFTNDFKQVFPGLTLKVF
jgi:hypothetical protein